MRNIHIYIYIYIYVYDIHIHIWIYISIYIHTYVQRHTYRYMNAVTHTHFVWCTSTVLHTYIHTYIHTHACMRKVNTQSWRHPRFPQYSRCMHMHMLLTSLKWTTPTLWMPIHHHNFPYCFLFLLENPECTQLTVKFPRLSVSAWYSAFDCHLPWQKLPFSSAP